ncbi:MAG: GHMP kinase [Deltaproteobacteria bacterium]|jgi:D-glycero-alpha-D-manno-heptose-7-phosphate kinase|nr:GHMP kinase [Deltaproteobacteria bacterium]
MIINRTPFRISFAGGGSDLEAFYHQHEGCVLSTSINKYMYLIAHPFAVKKQIQVKYSTTELVDMPEKIKHPIIREALKLLKIDKGIEIASFADISAGTGLGSSSSFTVGLIHCLKAYLNSHVSKEYLANTACDIEINRLEEPIGKQDQYAAAFGGLNFISFLKNGTVCMEPVTISVDRKKALEENLLMFFTGSHRSASKILKEQKENINNSEDKVKTLLEMTKLARKLKQVLYDGDLDDFGPILHEGWELKQSLASGISNPEIEKMYHLAISKGGASGGKLLGAGGSGYLLFYCPKTKQAHLRKTMQELEELPFQFDDHGSNIIFYDKNI